MMDKTPCLTMTPEDMLTIFEDTVQFARTREVTADNLAWAFSLAFLRTGLTKIKKAQSRENDAIFGEIQKEEACG